MTLDYVFRPNAVDAQTIGHDLSGTCPVCGREAVFFGFTDNVRESGFCSNCGSTNRQRQMAECVRQAYDLNDLGEFNLPDGFSIFKTESNGALHKRLEGSRGYVCSEFFGPDVERGSHVGSVMHQDLMALTFDDEQFDLVLSSDVFEHIPRPYDAHSEVLRVLKPSGRHIFTVPFAAGTDLDDIRAVERNGVIEYFGEKLYHGDPVRPNEGVLVWTIFGIQMLNKLERMDFDVSFRNLFDPSKGIIGEWSLVFEARKPVHMRM